MIVADCCRDDAHHELVPADLHAKLSDLTTQIGHARAWLADLDTTRWVHHLVDKVEQDITLAEHLGHHSVAHPNGFDLITVVGGLARPDHSPAYRVRLHLWWPRQHRLEEDVHNHAWDFTSRVLTGHLRFVTYSQIGTGGQFFWHYPYQFGSAGSFDPAQVQRVRLSPGLDVALPCGTHYTFDHRQLHRVVPLGDQPVATLVVTGTCQRTGSDIYSERRRDASGARIPHTELGADGVRQRLRRLADAL